MTQTVVDTSVLDSIDLDKEVPCHSSLHYRYGTGPATWRIHLKCPKCSRDGKEDNVCDGCLDWFVKQHVNCFSAKSGCGYRALGAVFIVKKIRL